MKFDQLEKEAISIGDIKQNNVSIDTANIDFIVTILSTNLYSNPIQSFIRETVSNAWDSHIEANVKEPVILELGVDTEGKYFCRIQDFGVGLSPERFNNVYRNIGSSTKRTDNSQIGGFGIGRFSALAYSDVVYITTNYNNIQYKYMMYKDGNSISIDLIHQQDTEERNGLEVLVNLKSSNDLTHFYQAIKDQLVYFENLYFVDNTKSLNISNSQSEFNNFYIKKYNNFYVNSLIHYNAIDIVLGKVRYPLRFSSLTKSYPSYIQNYPITLKFDIGDLQVTPNREEILYNQKNISVIENRLDKAIEELDIIFKDNSKQDYDSLSKYISALQNSQSVCLLEVDDQRLVNIPLAKEKLHITLNGVEYNKKDFLPIYEQIMRMSFIPVSYEYYGGKITYTPGSLTSLNNIKSHYNKHLNCDVALLNNMSKSYIRDTFEDNTRFLSFNHPKKILRKFIKDLKDYFGKTYNSGNYDYEIVRLIYKSLFNNIAGIKRFSNSSVPQSYITQKKAEEKAKRALRKNAGIDWSQNINLYNLRYSDRGYLSVTSDPVTYNLKQLIGKYKCLTIYSEKDSEKLRLLYNILRNTSNSKVKFVEVAPTRMKLLESFNNFVKLEDFMKTDYKLLRKIGTAIHISKTVPHILRLYPYVSQIAKVSLKLSMMIEDLHKFHHEYSGVKSYSDSERSLTDEIYQLCLDENYFDEEIKSIIDGNISMLEGAKALELFIEKGSYNQHISNDKINLIVDYVLARKLFRPDVSAVIKLKKETIFNNKEDESN